MEQRFAHLGLVSLVLTALFGSVTLPAAGDVAKPGTIVTVAGTGQPGFSGDGGPATQAVLNGPFGLALDGAGNLYIVDVYNYRIRKVSPNGTITTAAGTGQPGFSGDNGKATEGQLKPLVSVAVDGAGNLFIADFYNHRVRKVDPVGMITTVAGSGPVDAVTVPGDDAKNGGFSGDDGPATDARLNGPAGVAVDAPGNLFIGDYYNSRVRKVDAATGMITTVAGNGHPGFSGDGGKATDARLDGPVGLAVDGAGNLFIAEYINNRVRKVSPDGMITTVAGGGHPADGLGDGGKATDARLNRPGVPAVDSAGNLFIPDNYRVRKVDAVTGLISTVAGNGKNQPYAGDGGLATDTGLRDPAGLAIDAVGSLLIAERVFPRAAPYDERVLKVFGVAAPGLIAGIPFPMPKQP